MKNPYRAIRRDGFPSIKHSHRAKKLKTLEQQGVISNLEFEKPFKLIVNDTLICRYYADFCYTYNGKDIVEDVKGMVSPVYLLKKKLMLGCLGIAIREV